MPNMFLWQCMGHRSILTHFIFTMLPCDTCHRRHTTEIWSKLSYITERVYMIQGWDFSNSGAIFKVQTSPINIASRDHGQDVEESDRENEWKIFSQGTKSLWFAMYENQKADMQRLRVCSLMFADWTIIRRVYKYQTWLEMWTLTPTNSAAHPCSALLQEVLRFPSVELFKQA